MQLNGHHIAQEEPHSIVFPPTKRPEAFARQATPQQRFALDVLINALHYLVDERSARKHFCKDDLVAALLLSTASRAVSLECAPAQRSLSDAKLHIRWSWIPFPPFALPMFLQKLGSYPGSSDGWNR